MQGVAPATRVPEIAADKIPVQLNLSAGCAASRTPCLKHPGKKLPVPPRTGPDFLPLSRQVARPKEMGSERAQKRGIRSSSMGSYVARPTLGWTNDRDRASPTHLGKARPKVRQAHQVSRVVAVCPATLLSDPQTTELLAPLLVELRLLPL